MSTTTAAEPQPPADATTAVPAALTCCSLSGGGALPPLAADTLARVFKALGDPTRVQLLSLIAGAQGGEACACDLVEPVRLSQPTVSHHMKVLLDAGLVSREQRGKWAYYRVAEATLDALSAALRPSRRP